MLHFGKTERQERLLLSFFLHENVQEKQAKTNKQTNINQENKKFKTVFLKQLKYL